MAHLVVLLEEVSARDALEVWLPKWLPANVPFQCVAFQGKQDLEKQMVKRLRGWLRPDSRFLVLRDQDSGDCKVVKQALVQRCVEAGRPEAVVRVACRELESFFVGDWAAVAQAYGKPALAQLQTKAKYRNPDALESPAHELKQHLPEYQKREGARRIAPHLDPARCQSRSFKALHAAVLKLGQA